MDDPRISAQIEQLQNPVDRLWWFAQLERGIERSGIDRTPHYGSMVVLTRLCDVCGDPRDNRYRSSMRVY